ncbi:MAG TPA: VWA domain-containing protein [Chloroflexota bacterium]|nr:VWA domain-containing protein [Chloroflexota bacterium]
MSLLTPWALAWIAAAAAIAALYFLKPRSRRVEVSSTWLWQSALREEIARSPIQWLKRHLLLLLQLLVALLGVFALARPALSRDLPVGRTIVLAIDASTAMLANDGDPGAAGLAPGLAPPAGTRFTRLDEARARAISYLRTSPDLQPGDRIIVLRAADRAEVRAQGTLPQDRGTLENELRRLQPLPGEVDLAQTLEVAAGLTSSARRGLVIFFTGGVVDTETISHQPAVALQVVRVGQGQADNQAITALSARRTAGGDLEVFVRVRNFGDQEVQGTLRLRIDGQDAEPRAVTLPPQGSQPLLLSEFPSTASVIEARFERNDLLALDNLATAAVSVAPLRRILLVGGRTEQLERALKAVPGVELTKAEPQQYATQGGGTAHVGYDIYVFEGWFPPSPPPGHWLLIDPPTSGSPVRVAGTLGRRTDGGRETNDAQIARVLPSPLLNGVDLTGVGVTEAKKVVLPDWAEEVVSAREAPLIFMGYPRPYRAVVFAFDLRASQLLGRIGFPILVANTVNWLTGDAAETGQGLAGLAGLAASEGRFTPQDALLIQPLPRATRVQIETPSKRRYQFDGNQPVRFVDTREPGAYTVTQFAGNQEIVRRVYVASLLTPGREAALSDLHPRPNLEDLTNVTPGQPPPFGPGPGREAVHAEWWRLLGVLALVGLLAEWWWYHR